MPSPARDAVDGTGRDSWMITFDDGGSSSLLIAEKLASYGWPGHFFITTGKIGRPGFVTPDEIRRLHELGHVVGSHSETHPERMSRLAWADLMREWGDSVRTLSEILGEDVVTGSVPGGYYSKTVARAAAEAGIRVLFNSEPVTRPHAVDGSVVVGRFSLHRDSQPELAVDLVRRRLPRARQFAGWNARKAAKSVGGNAYLRLRQVLLSRH